ncbi:MAG: hypothetical protein H0V34_12955 [Gammaproteobacteria bacterium]|nr:hypothetical protein [Gammaproteobacteria bacterium]
MHKIKEPALSWTYHYFVLLFFILLPGCGGGGDGADPGGSQPTPDFVVSGTVSAPNATIAFRVKPRFLENIAQLMIPAVHARLNGTRLVPDGTLVRLVRINRAGNEQGALASTKTVAGKYGFNLTKLRLKPANNLIVKAVNKSTGALLRAFVSHQRVDIDPISEASVRVILNKVAVTQDSLSNFTPNEVAKITAAIELFARVNNLRSATDIEETVTAIEAALADDSTIRRFVSAAAQHGETNAAPGDIGNYFPFDQRAAWNYQGKIVTPGQITSHYGNTVTVEGTRNIAGANTTVFLESYPLAAVSNDEQFFTKSAVGITDWSEVADGVLTTPYTAVSFPPVTGSTVTHLQDVRLNNLDIDGDYRADQAVGDSKISIAGFGFVEVPAGRFQNALIIKTTSNLDLTSSQTGARSSIRGTSTEWYAAAVGLVKKEIRFDGKQDTQTIATSITEELTSVSGLEIPPGEPGLPEIVEIDLKTNDIVYDAASKRAYASVPSREGARGNSITIINPQSAKIEHSIFVGSEPGPLALSKNGARLYVGLQGTAATAAIRPVDLSTRIPGASFSLGRSDSSGLRLIPEDIEVSPDDPAVIAVSGMAGGESHQGIAIFQDGVRRSKMTPNTGGSLIEFSESGSILYGYTLRFSSHGFYTYSVDEYGITETGVTEGLIDGENINVEFQAGRIYAGSGEVVDAMTSSLVGKYDVPDNFYYNRSVVAPDAAAGRVYFASLSDDAYISLEVFDLDTFTRVGTFAIPNQDFRNRVVNIVKAGSDHLLIGTQKKVFVVDTRFIN